MRFWKVFLILPAILAFSVQSAAAQSLLRDAEIEQWLEDYSYPLFEAAGLEPQNIGIHIVGDTSINAFVSNGQNMFVNTGLFTNATTPNQIEGVLAHETGHIAGGHLARGADAMNRAQIPMMMSLVLGAAAIAAGAPEAGMVIMGVGQSAAYSGLMTYSRGQESAADQAAISYLEKVGSSGEGLNEFFAMLRNEQLIRDRRYTPYYQSHPMASARISALRERVDASPFKDVKDTDEDLLRLQMIQAKINGFMQDPFKTLRQYPLKDQSKPARYARAVAYYRASNLTEASKVIDTLIQDEPNNPFFYELKGQMYFEHGKIRESIPYHKKSVELAPQYALLQINLGRAMVAVGEEETTREAIQVLKNALSREQNNYFGWTEIARAYGSLNDNARASLAQAEAYFNVGNKVEAHRFATRATQLLPTDTIEWRQANDIVLASLDDAMKVKRDRKGRPLPRRRLAEPELQRRTKLLPENTHWGFE